MSHVAVPTPSFQNRVASVLLGELVNKVSVILAFVWLSRVLDRAVYGDIEWALSILFVATVAADAGLTTWGAAEVGAKPAEAAGLVRRIGRLRLTLALPAYLMMLAAGWGRGGTVLAAVAVYGLVLWLTPFFLHYLFNGLFQTRWVAIGNAAKGLTFLAAVLALARPDSSAAVVAAAEVTGALAMVLIHVVAARRVLPPAPRTPIDRQPSAPILPRSWTIGASEVVWGVYWYAGLVLVGYLATSQDAAWYSAALRIVMALHTPVYLYLYVLLPTLARLLAHDQDDWRRTVQESVGLAGWSGLGVALVGVLGAEPILRVVFGAPFAASGATLQVMVWVVPIAWLSGHIRYSLIAIGQPRRDYQAALIGTVTTVALTVALVPALRSLGAGIALLGGLLANAVAAWVFGRRQLPRCGYLAPMAPSAVACAACWLLGLGLTPLAGRVAATIVAGSVFGGVALFVERDRARLLLRSLTGAPK